MRLPSARGALMFAAGTIVTILAYNFVNNRVAKGALPSLAG